MRCKKTNIFLHIWTKNVYYSYRLNRYLKYFIDYRNMDLAQKTFKKPKTFMRIHVDNHINRFV